MLKQQSSSQRGALSCALFFSLTLLGLWGCSSTYTRKVPCNQITSWDECEKASHCSAVRFFVPNDYKGPAWACESKNQR